LPIFGERIFPIGSMDRGRGTMLSMSMLMAARGAGALVGPFISGHLARGEEARMRWGILFSFPTSACGYVLLGFAPSIWAAMAAVALAHAGGSTSWVFSTTLLQLNTEDEFRGRVFSADLGFCMLTYAISSYAA